MGLASNTKGHCERGEATAHLNEASLMVSTFASCGAASFVVTKAELEWPDRADMDAGCPLITAENAVAAVERNA
jgi:hypothetical protein